MKTQGNNLEQGQELRGNEQQESLQQQTSTGGQQELGRSGGMEEESLSKKGDTSKERGSQLGSGRELQSDLDEE